MNDPIKPLPSTMAPDTIVRRRDYDKTSLPSRSSYTPTNAQQFKEIFDRMMETQQNQEIHCSAVGLKPRTLYIKAQDALKWLSECHPTETDKYTLLRGRISISCREDRILIYFKTSLVTMIKQGSTPISNVSTSIGWKDELIKWIETAQEGEIFERKDISISADDRLWLYNMLAGLGGGVEVEAGLNNVRVMR